jgi:hypothetical protein
MKEKKSSREWKKKEMLAAALCRSAYSLPLSLSGSSHKSVAGQRSRGGWGSEQTNEH